MNGWILSITYGLCFGVELIMNNKVVLYFYRYHAVDPQVRGVTLPLLLDRYCRYCRDSNSATSGRATGK